jgi:CysZ protein
MKALESFWMGSRYLWLGMALMRKPGIRRFVLIPLVISAVMMGLGLYEGLHQVDVLDQQWAARQDWWGQLWNAIAWLAYPLLVVLILALSMYLFAILANWIGAPFNSLMAEHLLHLFGIPPVAGKFRDWLASIPLSLLREVRKLVYFIPRALLVAVLWFFPLTTPVAVGLWFLLSAWMMTLQFVDYAHDIRGHGLPETLQWMRRHRAMALGFGAACTLWMMIPVANLLLMPAAVAGATAMWADLETQSVSESDAEWT